MVALAVSLLFTILMTAGIVLYARRRPVGAPLTWGEAMVACTYIFALLFLAYGIVPHQWLTWADNELEWRSDALLIGPGSETATWFPFTLNKLVIRDIIATAIYGVFLGAHIGMWAWWQNRGKAKPASAELETSKYGRPLVRRG